MLKLETTGRVSVLRLVLAVRWHKDEDVSKSLCVYDAGDGDYAMGWHTLSGRCEWTANSMLMSVLQRDNELYTDAAKFSLGVLLNPTSDKLAKECAWGRLVNIKGKVPSTDVVVGSVDTSGVYYAYITETGVK